MCLFVNFLKICGHKQCVNGGTGAIVPRDVLYGEFLDCKIKWREFILVFLHVKFYIHLSILLVSHYSTILSK